MRKNKAQYREAQRLCMNCGNKITPEVSKRKFCVMCGLKYFVVIRALKLIKLDFLKKR